jgi:hypothetical protein
MNHVALLPGSSACVALKTPQQAARTPAAPAAAPGHPSCMIDNEEAT